MSGYAEYSDNLSFNTCAPNAPITTDRQQKNMPDKNKLFIIY